MKNKLIISTDGVNMDYGIRRSDLFNENFGCVIGTYGSPCYIHLNLHMHRKNNICEKMLVHDDNSDERYLLSEICKKYNCSFSYSNQRLNQAIGDLCVFASGIRWANNNNLDFLIKVSRRFIPINSYKESFINSVNNSKCPTISNKCNTTNIGFRTELIGLEVQKYMNFGIHDIEREIMCSNSHFVEGYMHDLARKVFRESKCLNNEYVHDHYGVWDYNGKGRHIKSKDYLWHDWADYIKYYILCISEGIFDYDIESFKYPDKQTKKMTMMDFHYPRSINGGTSLNEDRYLYSVCKTIPDNSIVTNVGTWKGSSSVIMLESLKDKNITFNFIDCFDLPGIGDMSDNPPVTTDEFRNNISKFTSPNHKINIIKSNTLEMSEFPSSDFFFIDAGHTKECIKNDASLAYKCLKKGGRILFHDYGQQRWSDVKPVIDSIFKKDTLSIYECMCLYSSDN